MVRAIDIGKDWGSIRALEDVSFEVAGGELFGFIGPDGAGKTTLFRLITTLLIPDRGNMKVMDLDSVTDYREIRKNVGYMPGRFSLYADLTVEENLNFYATVFGTSVEKNYHLIKDIYSHIEPFRKRQAGKLSGGMKQKLALSCALIHAPKIIVLDEPTTGVDAVSRVEFWEMLRNLKKEGITVIVSTPYMDEAMRCDRVALIQKGKLLKINSPTTITKEFGSKLYAARSSDRFRLINYLRSRDNISSVNLFGDSVHLTYKDDRADKELAGFLREKGLTDVTITEVEPGIEDVFLRLTDDGNE